MKTISQQFSWTLIGAALCLVAMSSASAQDAATQNIDRPGDPARWYQEDMTPHAYYLTLTKEAGAAYGEAVSECKHSDSSDRARCLQEARRVFKQDMADAKLKSQANR